MGRGSFHAKVLVLFIKNGRLPLQLIKKNTVEMQEDFLRKFCGCVCYFKRRNIHTELQLEVRNYDNKLQPVSRGHLCTNYLFATILSYAYALNVFTLGMAWHFPFGSVFNV